jgi:heat shock protein HslJ
MIKLRTFLSFVFLTALTLAACSGGVSQPSLEATAWVLTEIQGQPVLAETWATLRFENGKVAGYDGCNWFDGAYTASGGGLTFGSLMTTMRACLSSLSNSTADSSIMQQAQAYHAALETARKYAIHENRLTILDQSGVVLLTFSPQDTQLEGKTWQLTSYYNGKDSIQSVLETATVTAEFASGRLAGSAGCNSYSATYTQAGSKLTFGPAISTLMACAEAGAMEQESAYLAVLPSVVSYRMEGERLTLFNAEGLAVAEFVRKAK